MNGTSVEIKRSLASGILPAWRSVVFFIGCYWAIYGWALWPLTPHMGHVTALASAIWLAPAYLLVSIRRNHGYAMRTFVATSLAILMLSGLQIVPGRIDLIWVYLYLPPSLAIFVAAMLKMFKNRK